MCGPLHFRGVTSGGEGAVAGVILNSAEKQGVHAGLESGPAGFCGKTPHDFNADVYRKSTGGSVQEKFATRRHRPIATLKQNKFQIVLNPRYHAVFPNQRK